MPGNCWALLYLKSTLYFSFLLITGCIFALQYISFSGPIKPGYLENRWLCVLHGFFLISLLGWQLLVKLMTLINSTSHIYQFLAVCHFYFQGVYMKRIWVFDNNQINEPGKQVRMKNSPPPNGLRAHLKVVVSIPTIVYGR